jgi:ATP-binding cassette subfamily B protein
VDTRTEIKIQEAMGMLMRGRTSFVIAHRLRTVAGADQILVIDKGRIVEQGSHSQLMAREGMYHRMFEMQLKGIGT